VDLGGGQRVGDMRALFGIPADLRVVKNNSIRDSLPAAVMSAGNRYSLRKWTRSSIPRLGAGVVKTKTCVPYGFVAMHTLTALKLNWNQREAGTFLFFVILRQVAAQTSAQSTV
jgi:hypothetical protein